MDAIIFDVDGTLWDSTELAAKAWNHILETKTSLPPTVTGSSIKPLFGKPIAAFCSAIFTGIPNEQYASLGAACEHYENDLLYKEPVPLYPGVTEAFQALSEKCPLFIVSNCQKGYIEALLDTTPVKPYVTDHLCHGDTLLSKADTIRILMEKHHLKKVLYVGDTQGDANACKEAKIPFAWVTYGFGKAENPDYQIHALLDLLELPIWN